MKRRLFCEISPFTYYLSKQKECLKRYIQDRRSRLVFSETKGGALPVLVYKHNSLIRRKLGNVNMDLQENKAVNLSIAAPLVSGILIRPGEVFSFWRLVGSCTKEKGYKQGLTISLGKTSQDIGGGMCQFTNLLHWMVLHSPLEVIEIHHHNDLDLFPDYGRQIPFGCGTSIMYNYLDYRVKNNTENTFQFMVELSPTHLRGELRAASQTEYSYHIEERDSRFIRVDGDYYRMNKVYRNIIDKSTGVTVECRLIVESRAKVAYDFTP